MSPRSWAVVGVIALVIIDIVLVVWAITAVRSPDRAAASGSNVRTVASATPSPTPTPTATPDQTVAPAEDAVAPTRLLAALDASTAWRAQAGACPATAATAEHTADGGATWIPSDAVGPTGGSALVALTVQSARQASAVALSASGCAPEFIRTYVAGDNWAAYADQLGGSWYFEGSKAGVAHAPGGDVATPCAAIVGLAVRDASNAAVLCANHDAHRTSDGGANWSAATNATGAVAITANDAGYTLAVTAAPDCAGVATVTVDAASGQTTPGGCATTAPPAAGSVTIAAGSGTVWVWAGDAVVKSGDGGKTWQ
ncbi:hypothetical protein ACFVWR_00330 [Leifsonia sp. NPDC058292]|uniref:hypothetical protein n=1 Tax=Leifsonia sp. NPDC058292 TaxID=3346428 RepID=UPI0036DC0F60